MSSGLFDSLRLPVMAAPMFLISGPRLVIAACRAGIAAGFPAANARTTADLDDWMTEISSAFGGGEDAAQHCWAINVLVHKSYERFDAELALLRKHKPPFVITALGDPSRVYDAVRGYGGKVFTDVISLRQAQRAVAAGVDGLILVCAGAGGHTGTLNPFGFVRAVREFWSGPLILAGSIADGVSVRAAEALGADLAYIGSPFMATDESLASDEYCRALIEASADDIVASRAVTGVLANWVAQSLKAAGWTDDVLSAPAKPDFSGDLNAANKPWKHLVSAGHGIGRISRTLSVGEYVDCLIREYQDTVTHERERVSRTHREPAKVPSSIKGTEHAV